MRDRTAAPPPGLPARWPGTCAICHQPFPKGTRIAKQRGEPCHVECYMEAHE